jgi:hypothetical protein
MLNPLAPLLVEDPALKRSSLRSAGTAAALATTVMAMVAGCGAISRPPASGEVVRGWSAVAFSSPSESREATVFYRDRDRLTKLVAAGFDVWSVDVRAHRVKGKLNAEQAKVAKSLGMDVEWPTRQTAMRADAGYRNYDQILARLKALAAKHPEFATLHDIGDSWETTAGKAKRDIWALRLTTGGSKPNVTIAGCHHAREIVTPELTLKMAEHLVEGYGTDAEATALVDSREIWIIPLVNPDAHSRAVGGADWRKNANNETGGKRRIGVDLNRNYDIAWGTVGDSGNPEADTFRGKAPFSEPETQAIRDQLTKHKPVVYLTYHSFSNSVMWPWDHKEEPPPNPNLAQLGKQLGAKSGYDAYQGCDMYLNSGDDVDWAFAKLGSLSYTVEVGSWSDGFMPSFSKLAGFWEKNRPMMLHAMKVADKPGQVFGPEVALATTRGPGAFTAKGATTAEAFVGLPGQPGTGLQIALQGGRATLPAAEGARRPVWVHARGANGTWGPWSITWSK